MKQRSGKQFEQALDEMLGLSSKSRYAPPTMRLEILQRDNYKCRYCDTPVTNETANIDHVHPWKYHGKTSYENCVTACRACNKLKLNRTAIEPMPLRRPPPDKHRRVGCRKPNCTMSHRDLRRLPQTNDYRLRREIERLDREFRGIIS